MIIDWVIPLKCVPEERTKQRIFKLSVSKLVHTKNNEFPCSTNKVWKKKKQK